MRDMGVRGLLIYCQDYQCSHWLAMSENRIIDDPLRGNVRPRLAALYRQDASTIDDLAVAYANHVSMYDLITAGDDPESLDYVDKSQGHRNE